jgi:hypothetical protein
MPFFCSLIKYCCFGEKIGVYLSVDLNLSLEELPKNLFFRRLLLSFRRWIHLLINEMSCFLQFIIYYYTQNKFLHWNLHFMSLNYHLVGNHSGSYLALIISRTHFHYLWAYLLSSYIFSMTYPWTPSSVWENLDERPHH